MPKTSDPVVSRRGFLKAGAMAGATTFMGGTSLANLAADHSMKSAKATGALDITIAGYALDHVRALTDGKVQVKGCNARFQPGKIGYLNTHVFSGSQELEATEIGLSPFMLAYANEGFRDYSLIPVFPIRLFRHKSVFIHADRGSGRRPKSRQGIPESGCQHD